MISRTKLVATVFLAAFAALAMGACKDNPAATEACKEGPKTSTECRDCCHLNGADGYKFFDDKCACMS